MEEISLSEYAAQHGKDADRTRVLAQRGAFSTAHRVDGAWVVDPDEPYPDDRRRKPSEVLSRDAMDGLTVQERNSLVRGELIRRLSKWGAYQDTFSRLYDRLTPSLIETCTPEQLAQIIDLLKAAYDDGRAAGSE